MKRLQDLPEASQQALRERFHHGSDEGWVLRLAAREGWLVANRRYLASMRERRLREMLLLMQAVEAGPPETPEGAFRLLETATLLHSPTADVRRVADNGGETVLSIRLPDCPTHAQIEESGWRGVTACGNWHRRQGWYDALRVSAEDALLVEKKWGAAACAAIVRILQPQHTIAPAERRAVARC